VSVTPRTERKCTGEIRLKKTQYVQPGIFPGQITSIGLYGPIIIGETDSGINQRGVTATGQVVNLGVFIGFVSVVGSYLQIPFSLTKW
jgi:hypothetical protein